MEAGSKPGKNAGAGKTASPQVEQRAASGAADDTGTVTLKSASTATADAAPPTDL